MSPERIAELVAKPANPSPWTHRCEAAWDGRVSACGCFPMIDPERCWLVHSKVIRLSAVAAGVGGGRPGSDAFVGITGLRYGFPPDEGAELWMRRLHQLQEGRFDEADWAERLWIVSLAERAAQLMTETEATEFASWLEGEYRYALGDVWLERLQGVPIDSWDGEPVWHLYREDGYAVSFPAVAELWMLDDDGNSDGSGYVGGNDPQSGGCA